MTTRNGKRDPQVRSVNGTAVAAALSSAVWLWGIGSVAGLILGYAARREIAESRGLQAGDDLASTGIALGWIGLVATVLLLALFPYRPW